MNTLTKTINFEELSKLLRLYPALSCIHFEHPKVKISNRENLPNQFRTSEPVWDWIRSGLPKSNYYLKLSSDSLIRKLEIKSILRLIPHFSHERLEEMIELSELYQPLEKTKPTIPTAPMRESLTAREAMAKMLSAEPLSVKISHNHFISENHQDFVMVDKNLNLVSQDESLCASLSSNGMPNHGYFVYEMKLNKHSIKKTNIKKLVATMDDLHKYSIDFNNQHKQERIPHSYVEQAEEVMISFMNELNQSYITDRYKEIKKLYKGHSF
jgi:hypothetical protein